MTPLAACILTPLSGSAVWQRGADPAAVADGLHAVAGAIRERSRSMTGVYGRLEDMVRASDLEIVVRPFLDGIVIAVRQPAQNRPPVIVIEFATILAAMCLDALLRQPAPADLFRGAVAYGAGSIADGVLLGPVFQEAQECALATEGALVWLAPSAAAHHDAGSIASTILADHDILLAGRGMLTVRALRLRLDQPAQALFTTRAGLAAGIAGAIARQQSLRYLAWSVGQSRPAT